MNLQTVGLSKDFDTIVIRGEPATRALAVLHQRGERIIALDYVNTTPDYGQRRTLILSGDRYAAADLADSSVPLKQSAAIESEV